MEEDQEQSHRCRFCNKRFSSGRSLGGHMRSHLNMISVPTEEKLQLEKEKAKSDEAGGDIGSSRRSKKNSSGCNQGPEVGGHVGYGLRENPKKTWRCFDSDNGVSQKVEAGGHVGYGLRENPEKTWGCSDSQKGEICKECGKEFKSLKALYGHMRCHTNRNSRILVEGDSLGGGAGTQKQVLLDSPSENEGTGLKTRGSRLKKTRYVDLPSFSVVCASSSVSEIDQEKKDAAICLMMMSRGIGYWASKNSIAPEPSVSDSFVLEVVGSRRINNTITIKDGDFFRKGDRLEKTKKLMEGKQGSNVRAKENAWFNKEESEGGVYGSGFLRDRTKKVKLDASEDGFARGLENKKPKINGSDTEFTIDKLGYDVSHVELGMDSCKEVRPDCSDVDLGKNSFAKILTNSEVAELEMDLSMESESNRADWEFKKCSTAKRARDNAYNVEIGREFPKITHDTSDDGLGKDQYKKSRFECIPCNKTFHSYQALGGHRARHKKIKGCIPPRLESREGSIETDILLNQAFEVKPKTRKIENLFDRGGINQKSDAPKKTKFHECSICCKTFASGQALGGHKRAHFAENSRSGDDASETVVIQEQPPQIPDSFDLNLPAPVEEETDGHIGFDSWLTGSNHKHEPLVELMSS